MTATAAGPRPNPRPGLYLHLPFCSAICPYCDFAVRVGSRDKRSRFVAALVREIELAAADLPPALEAPDTVYFGGGTPSILEAADLERILGAVGAGFSPPDGVRVFLEANPEDVDGDSLRAWRRLGVDFLSLGIQSFDPRDLEFLGRRHTAAEARSAVELALEAGFETVSIDLIYGLPHHDARGWRRTLETAVEMSPDHLSCYELEIHRRTVFGKRRARGDLAELPEGCQAELFLLTHRVLADRGYPGYEVSNFARGDEHQSRHNRKYWRHVPYLGLGPSAHSFDGRRRWWNERLLPRWQARVRDGRPAVAGSEQLSDEDLALETVMLGLRTAAGIDRTAFRERFDFDLVERNPRMVESAGERGLLRTLSDRLVPTLEGLAVADALAASFDV
ncbi:MAG: radical SAM family heme chaperone HemW [Thermoanaerobaculia bacterium]